MNNEERTKLDMPYTVTTNDGDKTFADYFKTLFEAQQFAQVVFAKGHKVGITKGFDGEAVNIPIEETT